MRFEPYQCFSFHLSFTILEIEKLAKANPRFDLVFYGKLLGSQLLGHGGHEPNYSLLFGLSQSFFSHFSLLYSDWKRCVHLGLLIKLVSLSHWKRDHKTGNTFINFSQWWCPAYFGLTEQASNSFWSLPRLLNLLRLYSSVNEERSILNEVQQQYLWAWHWSC